MTHRGLVLPQLSRAAAVASRALNAPRTPLTFAAEPFAVASLRLSIDHGGSSDLGPDAVCLALAWGTDRLELRCPASLPGQILGVLDSALETDAMPSDLAALLLEEVLLPLITRCEQATGRAIAITALKTAGGAAVTETLGLVLEYGDRCWHLLLSSAEPRDRSPDPLAALLQFWPVAPRSMARFRLPAALQVGATVLPVSTFRSLQPGDAVLLQVGNGRSGMLVVAGVWTAVARQDGGGWRLTEAPRAAAEVGRTEWTMRATDAAGGGLEHPPINDPDQLPVQLTFEVGRLEMTLAELRRLGPGSVLELGRAIAEPVRICAQGRPVGQGELVDIEGMVGVKVVRLLDHE
jgi:type III secretion protein Q